MFQAEAQHGPVVVALPVAFQRLQNLRDLRPRTALSKVRDRRQIRFTLQQFLQHQLPGDSGDIGKHAAQLDVGFFENLLHPVALADRIANPLTAPPRQIP